MPKLIKSINIPYRPKQIKKADLKHGLLLPPKQIKQVKSYFKRKPKTKHLSKHTLNTDFSVTTVNGELFAIYRGRKSMPSAQLGKGGFGSVKLAQNLDTGEWVALKTLTTEDDGFNRAIMEAFSKHEFAVLKEVKLAVGDIGLRENQKGEDIYQILMKLVPGENLKNINANDARVSPVERLTIAISTVEFFQQLFFTQEIIHRDIKNGNIVANRDTGCIGAVDFAFAAKLINHQAEGYYLGTEYYLAPEIREKETNGIDIYTYNEATEVYALGKTLRDWFAIDKIKEKNGKYIPLFERNIPDEKTRVEITDLIAKMISPVPGDRPTMVDVIKQLKEIKENYLYLPAKIKKVLLLEANKVTSISDKEAKLLNGFDQVWLIDTDPSKNDLDYYIDAKAWLQEKGISVAESVYTHADLDELIATLPEHIDQVQANNLNQYFVVFDQDRDISNERIYPVPLDKESIFLAIYNKLEKQKISENDYAKITDILEGEVARLNKKYSNKFIRKVKSVDARINLLNETLGKLEEKKFAHELNYAQLIEVIENIQYAFPEKLIANKFKFFFESKTHTEKLFFKIPNEIKFSLR